MLAREMVGLPVAIPFSISEALSMIARSVSKLSRGLICSDGSWSRISEIWRERTRPTSGCEANATVFRVSRALANLGAGSNAIGGGGGFVSVALDAETGGTAGALAMPDVVPRAALAFGTTVFLSRSP